MKTLEAHHFKLCRMKFDCRCRRVARVHRAAVGIQPEARVRSAVTTCAATWSSPGIERGFTWCDRNGLTAMGGR